MAPFLDPTLRGDNGDVGIIRSPVRAIVLPDKLSIVAMPTLLVWRKAASGRPILQGRTGIAGVPSSGHASKGISQEPRRAPRLLLNMGGTVGQGKPEANGKDGRAVL